MGVSSCKDNWYILWCLGRPGSHNLQKRKLPWLFQICSRKPAPNKSTDWNLRTNTLGWIPTSLLQCMQSSAPLTAPSAHQHQVRFTLSRVDVWFDNQRLQEISIAISRESSFLSMWPTCEESGKLTVRIVLAFGSVDFSVFIDPEKELLVGEEFPSAHVPRKVIVAAHVPPHDGRGRGVGAPGGTRGPVDVMAGHGQSWTEKQMQ